MNGIEVRKYTLKETCNVWFKALWWVILDLVLLAVGANKVASEFNSFRSSSHQVQSSSESHQQR